MISKELLSEVLNADINAYGVIKLDELSYIENESYLDFYTYDNELYYNINIHELAHKCKEWAFEEKGVQIIHARKYGYSIGIVKYFSSIEVYNGHYLYNPSSELGTSTQLSFEADTEPEAIFKACEWILDNKE